MALRARGWYVTGRDADPKKAARALEVGAIDRVGRDPSASITFVATPVGSIAAEAKAVLADPELPRDAVVTDVAGVKVPVVEEVVDPRFVGGHPMAGSEQTGVDGADASLFAGAAWVLTPVARTDPDAYARVRGVVASLGAEVVALSPGQHDALVAVVSHVPHLAAATLMNLAGRLSMEQGPLLRLAAGGFRDMTRVAAGEPSIWPDVCSANSAAIVATLDALVSDLAEVRDLVAKKDREGLFSLLNRASGARRALPAAAGRPESLVELRAPVPDRPGVIAEITALAGGMGVNIYDLEIAHSAEGDRGVLVLLVAAADAESLQEAMGGLGYRTGISFLERP